MADTILERLSAINDVFAGLGGSSELAAGFGESPSVTEPDDVAPDKVAPTSPSATPAPTGDGTYDAVRVGQAGQNLAQSYGLRLASHTRSPERNRAVGGAKRSDHLTGMAVDLAGAEAQMESLYRWAKANEGPGRLFRRVIYRYEDPGDHSDHVHLSFNRQVGAGVSEVETGSGGVEVPDGIGGRLRSIAGIFKGERPSSFSDRRMRLAGLGPTAIESASATPVAYGRGGAGDLQRHAASRLAAYGWEASEAGSLIQLVQRESGWNPTAQNPHSTAFGLFQFLNCVPLDTEILTRDGWRRYHEVVPGVTETLGYSGGVLRWTRVGAVMVELAPRPLVTLGNKRWRVKVTPGHRWWSHRRTELPVPEMLACPECGRSFRSTRATQTHRAKAHGELRGTKTIGDVDGFVETERITTAHSLVLSAPAATDDNPYVTADEAAIIAWILGDGHIHGDVDGTLSVTIYQAKPPMVAVLDALLRDVPHSRRQRYRVGRTWPETSYYLHAAYARDLLKRSAVLEDMDAFVISLGSEQRAAFITAMAQAEGTAVKYPAGSVMRIAQADGELQKAIMLAAFLEGFRPRRVPRTQLQSHHKPLALVTLARPEVHGATLRVEPADPGPVWCPSTELGSWVMRQGDHICLTGNSTWRGTGISKTADPMAQIEAGLAYIKSRYGSPSAAWAFWQRNRWY